MRREYLSARSPWFIGFSGGKDSSALVRIVFHALKELGSAAKRPVTVVYCDTGVEIPIVAEQVRLTLRALRREARAARIPLRVRIAHPRLGDRYFVKVIGRGYPPPSNKFRWCTDRLRIDPIRSLLAEESGGPYTILLGLRAGESAERDRTLRRHSKEGYFFRQAGNAAASIFAPLLHFSTIQVWWCLTSVVTPKSIDGKRLVALYRQASGECPVIRDPRSSPCGQGRFGCWTCTVVRQDKAVSSLVSEGHESLAPLLRWRNWLASIRDDPSLRCTLRRNGGHGPGPFTLAARKNLLRKLRDAERQSGHRLVMPEEIDRIRQLWKEDRESGTYFER